MSPWSTSVLAAMAWWENGQLGVTYLDAPTWVHQAFAVVSRERARTMRYKAEIRRAEMRAEGAAR